MVRGGRRRVRRRRNVAIGAAAFATAGIVGAGAVLQAGGGGTEIAGEPPAPDAPTLTLADATTAVAGRDYRELASYTNDDLDSDNGQYLDGMTTDGLVLFRDGPRADQRYPRFALLDPATGTKDWLPRLPDVTQNQTTPGALGEDRLVLLGYEEDPTASTDGFLVRLVAFVFDRNDRRWSTVSWPALPAVESPSALVGPDDRLYVRTPATRPGPPPGGWPVGPDGEAEDADAEGETNHLWSVSLTDPADVRDEGLDVGDVAFTATAMVWTDSRNGDAGRIHVRDLATGAEHSFDPRSGERCNLLSFGAAGDRIVMGQYCGTYDGGVRDDRVQIVSTDGRQVVTLQGSGLDGGLVPGSGVVTVTAYGDEADGTYVYDLAGDRLLRVSDRISSWASTTGPAGGLSRFSWMTPVNRNDGATQHIGELLR